MNSDEENKKTPGDNPPGNDDNQPQNEPLQPATVGGPGNHRKMWWVWGLIILLILLLLFFGWWWWKDKDKKDSTANTNTNNSSQEQQPQEETACDEGYTAYENADLGIGFCYPTDWGTVTVADARLQTTSTTVDGTVIAADTGERWLVSFSAKPAVHLGMVTADWSTEVGRDGVCVDPAVQTLPSFSPFSTAWETEGTPVTYATRGIEVASGEFLIQEYVDDLLTNGVCVEGFTIIEGDEFTHTTASYSAEFAAPVTTPQQHIDNPNTLIPAADRTEFAVFVKSVHAL